MHETSLVIAGHVCHVQPSNQYSAVVDMQIDGCDVTLCFARDERPDVKQRIMKSLLDAYEQRMRSA